MFSKEKIKEILRWIQDEPCAGWNMMRGLSQDLYDLSAIADKEGVDKIKGKVIELNHTIDNLIDVTHEEYLKQTDVTEQSRLDGKIKAYWEVKDHVENILAIE